MIQSGINDCIYAVIMAGGSGTRFWPRSRKNRPKQLLNITGDEILLKKTIELIPCNRYFCTFHRKRYQGCCYGRSACRSLY
ncbi:MAG: hypothetical protein JRJ45_14160 [Deltaproteobacteria bacterium]|nr:hypothetical protein [Deltaproteobacteria bacterium]